MAAKRKKPARPRKNLKVKAKKRSAVPAGLRELDAGWTRFIAPAVEAKRLTAAWSDPKAVASRPRKSAGKKTAAKAAKKTTSKKRAKRATKKASRK